MPGSFAATAARRARTHGSPGRRPRPRARRGAGRIGTRSPARSTASPKVTSSSGLLMAAWSRARAAARSLGGPLVAALASARCRRLARVVVFHRCSASATITEPSENSHLVARPVVHDVEGVQHGRRPSVGAEELVARLDLAHGRPAVGVGSGVSSASALPRPGRPATMISWPGVQAVEQAVEVGEAGRHAGHHAALRADRLDLVERGLQHVGQDREVFADPPLGDVVDRLLGQVDDVVDVAAAAGGRAVAELDDAGAGLDQAAQHRPLADDARVVRRRWPRSARSRSACAGRARRRCGPGRRSRPARRRP